MKKESLPKKVIIIKVKIVIRIFIIKTKISNSIKRHYKKFMLLLNKAILHLKCLL
jgi:hypothetical protein